MELIHQSLGRAEPGREAFRCRDGALTYAELDARANALAGVLLAGGGERGDRVGVMMGRSTDAAVAVYAALKAGGAFVPIDPFAPAAAVAKTVVHCGIKQVLTHPLTERRAMELRSERPVGLEQIIDVSIAGESDEAPDISLSGDDLAYLIGTSGSTGEPKCIAHTHASGLAYARLSQQLYGLAPEDRIASHSALHFDMSTLGFIAGPYAGATTVIVPEGHTKFPASLAQLLEEERVTVLYCVPFALSQLLAGGVLEKRDLGALRWVLFGGEPSIPKDIGALMERWPGARFVNVYGPAEVNQCTSYEVPIDGPADGAIPIGRAWDETECRVLDEADAVVAHGGTGELVVHTTTMMRGYWRKFDDPSPFYQEAETGRRFYRTGDLATLGEEGLLHYAGRKDRQVKVRGYRIELDAVEGALISHPEVADGAVVVFRRADGASEIAAVAVLEGDSQLGAPDLLRHLEARLPKFALPFEIRTIGAVPRTAAGKVNRGAVVDLIDQLR